jgi:alkylation response protein AidB-like acyl-CoA dehydrogenase
LAIPQKIYEEDHVIFRDSVRKFVEQEVAPYHEQWEKDGIVPKSLWLKAGEAGLLAPTVPEEYGGPGVDFRYNGIVDEELARAGYTGPGFSLHSDIAVPYLVHYGSEEQKQEFLPKCVSGECIMAIAMTEPGTGSDLQGVKTTAALDGNEYVINGSKTFITNGQNSDLIIVVAKTDPTAGAKGTSLILVESHREGFKRGRNLEKLGMKAADTSEMFFDEVRVPTSNCLGEENMGFIYLMQDLPQERLSVAVSAVAACEGALQWTLDYTGQRKAFGKTISEFQNTKFKMAELKTEITIARVFVDRCLEMHIDGGLDVETAAMAKWWTTDLQGRVMDECLQLHGGYGFMWEYPITRAYADSRVQRIYAGTNEIMKDLISRKLWSN